MSENKDTKRKNECGEQSSGSVGGRAGRRLPFGVEITFYLNQKGHQENKRDRTLIKFHKTGVRK
jgi:hypothetical protein